MSKPLRGDINGDGTVSTADSVLLLRLLTEDSVDGLSDDVWERVDLNGDGLFTLLDITEQLQLLTK